MEKVVLCGGCFSLGNRVRYIGAVVGDNGVGVKG